MQRTRINTIVDLLIRQIEQFFSNPWRRISLILISLLLGIFVGAAVSTTAGQAAYWDVVISALLLLFTELVSQLVYSRHRRGKSGVANQRSLTLDVLNIFKIGITYSLYLEALKLGS
ncbi:MAG: DUF565 domain-containing protein [Moorea sp. SIO2B7]|nr:DUF565 domain-containing protein [Moorena sp. SIO2B7]